MSMKSPTADDVFKKWLERTDLGKLEKAFSVKHVKFERSNVSASESVKNVEKHAVFFFHSKIEPSISKEAEKKLVDIDELRKVTFYDFGNKQVDLTEWKDKNLVPLYSSIREVSCSECNGKGFIACDKCKGSGTLECKKCKGTGSLTCDACKGEKKLHLKLKVITAEGKKTDIEMPYNCDLCGGVVKFLFSLTEWKDKNLVPLYSSIREVSCSECNGKGFIACDKCKGSGTLECKKCKGTGSLTCDACKGEKKLHLKLKVITAEGKKTDIEMPYNCDLCGGVGTIYCDNCAGTGKIDCDKCHGGTKTPCKKCKATGTLFEYTIGPVPFKPAVIPKLFFRPEFEKYLGKVIDKEFANIEGIVIRDYE
ncbi:MAG: hypothetical protein KIH08_09090, partial [Candidatus Freyarchaeota archaeon]|nr:hypothetical protein [Candidatus Jordarchaeia archaeon]